MGFFHRIHQYLSGVTMKDSAIPYPHDPVDPAILTPLNVTHSIQENIMSDEVEQPAGTEKSATTIAKPQSLLEKVGADIKGFFHWLGSPQGQNVIQAGEGAAVVIGSVVGGPALGVEIQAGITLVNTWITEAMKSEAIAAAAGQAEGSGTEKAAAVATTMVPQLLTFLQGQKLTSAQVTEKAKTINDSVVTLLNALGPVPTTQTESK